MQQLRLFLPCAAGVEDFLAEEAHALTGLQGEDLRVLRGGVLMRASWRDAQLLNLHSRLAQRVLIELSHTQYRNEQNLYDAASNVAWEIWFTPKQSFKVEVTAQHSPLTSLNFAALKVKDAIADRFRAKRGERPDVDTRWPDVRIYVHLTTEHATLYIDTSGEPLFKRGWREDKGDAPLKETLAAAMLAASGWDASTPLYDPCCGSGTIAIEAAQIACGIAAGSRRRFAFEKMLPFQPHVWAGLKEQAQAAEHAPTTEVFGSDVAHRMVDFAERNAERAGVAAVTQFRGGDALQRMPPVASGVMLLNPPYGERIEVAGVAGRREAAQTDDGAADFFPRLATHWKKHYAGWTAWMLTPDLKLPGKMRLKESRRVPMWNGPIECRLFRFDMVAGSARNPPAAPAR
ncbi:class I SAM-dependent RNA methyltransferase [Pseudorhodoferax sp. Leaf267]|uniref:THUMP domain-containing class I SAM-dependent RNA methyltransferase n=1 Tax=Pseudorhodoferax sp. Leaf267 TaxID=1736316 RepID=UPI0006F81906|nr:THUMP domain-containing protein [Pseudorhodoferax sp. Leaf267]KQP12216.1 RNA methyltransferase [Pseudorhodoferax sp. Leaf267]